MAVDVFARTLALASLGNGGGGSAVDTYTKAEIDKMFGEAGTVQVEVVDVLPTEDIKENVIYLVPNGSTGENYYNECMYINGKWEIIGTTEIDLSSYVTKEELEAALADKVTADVLIAYATKEYVDEEIFKAHQLTEVTKDYLNTLGLTKFDFNRMPLGRYIIKESMDWGYVTGRGGSGSGNTWSGTIFDVVYNTGEDGDYLVIQYQLSSANAYQALQPTIYMNGYTCEVPNRSSNTYITGDWEFRNGVASWKTPTEDSDVANKKYVDTTVAAIEVPSIEGLATEEYVNNAVANATGNVNVFEGTQEEYDALSDEEKAKYTIVVIDDGEEV